MQCVCGGMWSGLVNESGILIGCIVSQSHARIFFLSVFLAVLDAPLRGYVAGVTDDGRNVNHYHVIVAL